MEESPASDKILVPVVTKEGPVHGYLHETDVGIFYRFSGIPYAKPPLGNLRFLVSIFFVVIDDEITLEGDEKIY